MALCEAADRWFDLMPNSASSGSMKVSNMSSTSAVARASTTARISWLTSVMKTIGCGRCAGSAR